MTSADGGSDRYAAEEDAVEAFLARQNEQRVRAAQGAARKKWGMSITRQGLDDRQAEAYARAAIALGAEAFWLAEDSPLELEMHEDLDKYGRWAREEFGCSYPFEDGDYYQVCPCAIAHTRVGLSVGMLVKERVCAICQLRIPEECGHRAGRLYEVEGGQGPRGFCRVCGGSSCEEHVEGVLCETLQTRIVVEADLEEISIVRRPGNPLARLTKIPMDWDSILRENPGIRPGQRASCNRCLGICRGIADPFADPAT
jgi:hypothetical protein